MSSTATSAYRSHRFPPLADREIAQALAAQGAPEALQAALADGHARGLARGHEEGFDKGLVEGRAIGEAQGRERGEALGRAESEAQLLARWQRVAAPMQAATEALRADPAVMQRWTRFKSRYLIDFTKELTAKVHAVGGPQVLTARNIFAEPTLNPASEAWFAQNLDDFLQTYDWTAPMAMPLMEKQTLAQSGPWLEQLVAKIKQRPGALDRTVFELQARDWTKKDQADIDGAHLADWMSRLKRQGATSFGYYPDNFLDNLPDLKTVRPALSNKWNP